MSDPSPQYRYPARLAAGLAVFSLLAIAGALQYTIYQDPQPDSYAVERAELRFEVIKAQLPPHATVAYFSDLAPGSIQDSTAFRGAQFALAPVLLVSAGPKLRADWGVGNFARPRDFAAAGAAYGMEVVRDCGQGVVLYRARKAAQ